MRHAPADRDDAWWCAPLAQTLADLDALPAGLAIANAGLRLARFGPNRFVSRPTRRALAPVPRAFPQPAGAGPAGRERPRRRHRRPRRLADRDRARGRARSRSTSCRSTARAGPPSGCARRSPCARAWCATAASSTCRSPRSCRATSCCSLPATWSPPTAACSRRATASSTRRCSPASRTRSRSTRRAARADGASSAPPQRGLHGHVGRQRHGARAGVPHRRRAPRSARSPTACASGRRPTAFELGTRRFGLLIMRLTLAAGAVRAGRERSSPASRGSSRFLFAVALAVGLTPELLPMVVSVTLARGALRMARSGSIVQAAGRDPRPRQHGRAVHRQDRHAHRGAHPARAPRRRRRARQRARARARLSEQLLRDRACAARSTTRSCAHATSTLAAGRKIDEVPFDFERRRVSVLVDDATGAAAGRQGRARGRAPRCRADYEDDGPARRARARRGGARAHASRASRRSAARASACSASRGKEVRPRPSARRGRRREPTWSSPASRPSWTRPRRAPADGAAGARPRAASRSRSSPATTSS